MARVLVRATLPYRAEMAVVKEIVPRIELGEQPDSPPPIQASIHMPVYHLDWRWTAGWLYCRQAPQRVRVGPSPTLTF